MVAAQLEFSHGMHVGDVELECWSSWVFGQPHIQILLLPAFEEQGRRAVLEVCYFVDQLPVVFGVQFGIPLAMGQQLR